MNYQSYGDETCPLVFYFHGAPGSIKEAAFLEASAKAKHLNIICLDRSSLDVEIKDNAYHLLLADTIQLHMDTHASKSTSVDLIGFSIGCHVALEVSLCLGDKVKSLHLISAAAPLDGGDFIDLMAGKLVFQLAAKAPFLFKLLTGWQSLLMRFSPNAVFKMLFASAQGDDKDLIEDPKFKTQLIEVLKDSFLTGSDGYLKDVFMYVAPWKDRVAMCHTPTYLWHGERDNWSPLAMADYLSENLPDCRGKQVQAGASHYSCLLSSIPLVCGAIAVDS